MLLSTAVQKWKLKGLKKAESLDKAKALVKKAGKRWTQKQQDIFDENWKIKATKETIAKKALKDKETKKVKPEKEKIKKEKAVKAVKKTKEEKLKDKKGTLQSLLEKTFTESSLKETLTRVKEGLAEAGLKLTQLDKAFLISGYSKLLKLAKKDKKSEVVKPGLSTGKEDSFKIVYEKLTKLGDKKTQSKLDFLEKDLWPYFNQLYFSNKLTKASWSFTRDTGERFRVRASYWPGRNGFKFSTRLFIGPYETFRDTVIHEMCHQAVTLLDGLRAQTAKEAHGPAWEKWMRHCGIPAARFDKNANDVYMTEEEVDALNKKKEAKKEAEVNQVPFSIYSARLPAAAKYFDPTKKMWFTGMVVGKNDQAGKRLMFITVPNSSRWQVIPATWMFKVDQAESDRIVTQDMLRAANSILGYKDAKSEMRATKRAFKNGGSFF